MSYFRTAAESAAGKLSSKLILTKLLRLSVLKHPRVASMTALVGIESEEKWRFTVPVFNNSA